ncbi:hypothetical protein NDU88_003712 [Pleurodeles waltl]|uniref:Uncharacterized protein n=1 Tax=Pleurodeles waltl TaxID=8319 RepID=A0AAV7NM84_PLEWA|nr:hypothetical protein NDU88_003712 [Pleurodeles waltl]
MRGFCNSPATQTEKPQAVTTPKHDGYMPPQDQTLCDCDGLAGTRPHTRPTCAAAACGVPEHHGAATNVRGDAGSTWEGGGTRRSPSTPQGEKENEEEKNGEERVAEEEERDRGVRKREDNMESIQGRRTLETGECFFPNWETEIDEAVDGGRNTVATWEAERKILPRFWRSVAYPGV